MKCKVCGTKMKKRSSKTMIIYFCPVCGNVAKNPT